MTPTDRDEFRRMLANALQPLQEQIDAIKIPLAGELDALKQRDEKHSGQHKLVLGEVIPRIVSEVEKTRVSDLAAIAEAVKKLADVANETTERQARTDQNVAIIVRQVQAAVVQVSNGRSTSIRPASLVAAESSVRTETAQSLMQVDVTTANKQTAAMATWQKRITTPLLILVPVLIEIIRQIFLPHH